MKRRKIFETASKAAIVTAIGDDILLQGNGRDQSYDLEGQSNA
jgi:hypothetical protein